MSLYNLDYENLEVCGNVNQSSKQILDNPMFWWVLKLVQGGLSKQNKKNWTKTINFEENH